MMIQEFEELTGFHPSGELYEAIEAAYTEFHGDKQAFCAAYKANEDGMAERIARKVDRARLPAEQAIAKAEADAAKEIGELKAEIQRLKAALEREEEWKPYESPRNVSQADYERLAGFPEMKTLSDHEAKAMIAKEFGFDVGFVEIRHEVAREEINRHNHIRRVGAIQRESLFYSWDCNYVCFEVRGIGYEMNNGALQMRYE